MGIIWSLLAVQGAIVLEYGPAGTTHYSMGLYGGLGLRFQNRLFTTHMSEDDVVMGDELPGAAAWKDTICQDKQGCTAHKRRGTALFICGGCNVTASDGGG